MPKLKQFIKALINMTERKNIKWTTTDDYSTQRGNKKFKNFVQESIHSDLDLNPRISWTGEFYGNIGSVLHVYDEKEDKKVYHIYIQTEPNKEPLPVILDDVDLEAYFALVDELIDAIKNYIRYN